MEQESEEEEAVRPKSAPAQEAISQTTVTAMTTLANTLISRDAMQKDSSKSMFWTNVVLLMSLVVVMLYVDMVPTSEHVVNSMIQVLKHVVEMYNGASSERSD